MQNFLDTFDPQIKKEKHIAYIRTSDRIAFKRCRRKWNWSSGLRHNLSSNTSPNALWMGSGFHYAMEDFHGYKKYDSAKQAFLAYCVAFKRAGEISLPPDYPELKELCSAMLDYYELWLSSRDPMPTFYLDGVPQVEVTFEVPLSIELDRNSPYSEVRYKGTIDRVCVDSHGRLCALDYKTAKMFGTMHYETDPQVTAYSWVMKALYPGYEIGDFIYQQHLKHLPQLPKILNSGEVSINKQQITTHRLYRKTLLDTYGSIEKVPAKNISFLNELATQEDAYSDRLIRRDFVHRSEAQLVSMQEQMLEEAEDMINMDLALYPNPTRDCAWDCPFQDACILMDCGDNYQPLIEELFICTEERDGWRKHLPSKEELETLKGI